MFREFVEGRFGLQLVEMYVEKLIEFSSLGLPDYSMSFFKLAIEQMGDSWRRFHHEQQRFPFRIFQLAWMSDSDFLREYRRMQECMSACFQCVDVEFSAVLLSYIPGTTTDIHDHENDRSLHVKIDHIRKFLLDVMVFCPISSDLVECLHGATQSRLHR